MSGRPGSAPEEPLPRNAVRIVLDTEIAKWTARGSADAVRALERVRMAILGAATLEGEAFADHKHAF